MRCSLGYKNCSAWLPTKYYSVRDGFCTLPRNWYHLIERCIYTTVQNVKYSTQALYVSVCWLPAMYTYFTAQLDVSKRNMSKQDLHTINWKVLAVF